MGRELKRVPLDFDWPLQKVWSGFRNPFHCAINCIKCDGSGYSPEAKRMKDLWYGYVPFKPEDRGSIPFTPDDKPVLDFAERQVRHSPSSYYGTGERAVAKRAYALCALFNASWSHHLNEDDVAALVASGRLMDFTHIWTQETRWKVKEPPYVPTPREVNEWGLSGMSHDSIASWVCIKAECARIGVTHTCVHCAGDGEIWPSKEAHDAYEAWQPVEPPKGDGYQIWETVSEGSPISPVFSTARDLAAHMSTTKIGGDDGTSAATWLAFIEGPGWAPSMVVGPEGVISGVEAIVATAHGP